VPRSRPASEGALGQRDKGGGVQAMVTARPGPRTRAVVRAGSGELAAAEL